MIADHSWLIRDGIARLLCELDPLCVIQTASDAFIFRETLQANPDVALVLIGKDLIGDEEEALFGQVRLLASGAVIGVLGQAFEHERVRKAVYHGAMAVIATGETRQAVSLALRQALANEVVLPTTFLPMEAAPHRPVAQPSRDLDVLTQREHDVFALLGRGLSVALIAGSLRLSPHTVRVHIARIMKKLDLRDRSALMHCAVSCNATSRATDAELRSPR